MGSKRGEWAPARGMAVACRGRLAPQYNGGSLNAKSPETPVTSNGDTEQTEPYQRSDFLRDLEKASRKLEPEEAEKKKAKGRRSSGRSPETA